MEKREGGPQKWEAQTVRHESGQRHLSGPAFSHPFFLNPPLMPIAPSTHYPHLQHLKGYAMAHPGCANHTTTQPSITTTKAASTDRNDLVMDDIGKSTGCG